mmetsp:Transcript_2007/g.5107  ORF Transcript_2007/g.5107 Transcript_2007/m.5107 type:complete len:97 (-) Transcript_2007:287-577(-)
MLRLVVLLVCVAVSQAFSGPAASRVGRAAVRMEGARINTDIDLDSPKVVTNLEVDSKQVMCRCWKSKTFPNCDAAHVKHNEATGDNVGPLIVSPKK